MLEIDAESLEEYYRDNLWASPGQHILEIGPTGSGKTNGMYFIADRILSANQYERLVWFDSCKSEEIAVLATMRPLKIHIPSGCKIDIREAPKNNKEFEKYDVVEWRTPKQLWQNIKESPTHFINVVSFKRYVSGGVGYVSTLNSILDNVEYSGGLLDLIRRYSIKGPMSLFIDEFQDVAPAKAYEMNKGHHAAGIKIQYFIDQMRSEGIRLAAASQGWPRILAGVRSQFQWNMPRRKARYLRDTTLSQYNKMFNKFKQDEAIITNPNNEWPYNTKLKLPFYGDGKRIWNIEYRGKLHSLKNKSLEEQSDNIFKDGYEVVLQE